MKLVKKLFYSLLISLVLSINCMNSMQNDIEAQLVFEERNEERDISLDLAKKPQLLATIFSWIPFCSNMRNCFKNKEEAVEDIEAPLLLPYEDIQEVKFSLDLFEELPEELIHYIFSYIPIQDKGLHNFLRYIESVEESPYHFVAQNLRDHYYDYRRKQLQSDCNAKAHKNDVSKKHLVTLTLSFMSTTKDTNYSWYEGCLLNQLIPRSKRIIDFPSYETIDRAGRDYYKEVSKKFKLLKNKDKNLAHQYINHHITLLNGFSLRLKEYYDFITVKEVKVSCGTTCQCNLGPIDFSEPMDFYSIMAGTGILVSSVSLVWLLAPIAWYYPASFGCSGLGCIIVPCYLNRRVANENKKNKQTFKAINKAINLLSQAVISLNELKEGTKAEVQKRL